MLDNLLDDRLDDLMYGETINRALLIVNIVIDVLEKSKSELIRLAWLDNMDSQLTNIKNCCVNYQNSENVSYLDSVDTYVDEILENINKIISVNSMSLDVNKAYGDYIDKYYERTENLIGCIDETENELRDLSEQIEDNKASAKTELDTLSNRITSEQQRLDTFALSYQNQMSNDQQEFNKLTSEFRQEFIQKKSSWDEEVKQIVSDAEELNNSAEKMVNELLEKFIEEKNGIISKYVESFDKYQEDVKKMVGIINTNTFSFKYREVADDAKKRARLWHFIAVISMICVAGFAIYAFISTTSEDTSWVKLVAKVIATGTAATIAAYAATQANKQEKVERYARKVEMELVAIDPFIV